MINEMHAPSAGINYYLLYMTWHSLTNGTEHIQGKRQREEQSQEGIQRPLTRRVSYLYIPTWIRRKYGLRGWILQHPPAEESPLHKEVSESAHTMGTTSGAGKEQVQAGQVRALGNYQN